MTTNKNEMVMDFGTPSSNNMLEDLNGLSAFPSATPSANLFEELEHLPDMPFDGSEQSEELQEEPYSVQEFIYNIESLLPEFESYFQKNKTNIINPIFDKSEIDQISEENKFHLYNGYEDIKFKNDDEVIEAIMGFLSVNILVERLGVLSSYYRDKMIAIYEQANLDVKTLDLPIIKITQTNPKPKPEVIGKPVEFIDNLKKADLESAFMSQIKNIEWSQMTKTAVDKIIQLMQSSKNEELKAFYAQLLEKDIIQVKPATSSYQVSSKVS